MPVNLSWLSKLSQDVIIEALAYYAKIRPECDHIGKNFDAQRSHADLELVAEALRAAKNTDYSHHVHDVFNELAAHCVQSSPDAKKLSFIEYRKFCQGCDGLNKGSDFLCDSCDKMMDESDLFK